jgi:hypothetical protein
MKSYKLSTKGLDKSQLVILINFAKCLLDSTCFVKRTMGTTKDKLQGVADDRFVIDPYTDGFQQVVLPAEDMVINPMLCLYYNIPVIFESGVHTGLEDFSSIENKKAWIDAVYSTGLTDIALSDVFIEAGNVPGVEIVYGESCRA